MTKGIGAGLARARFWTVLIVGALFLSGGARAAEDEGLYDPAPPAGAAFVRVMDVREGAAPGSTQAAGPALAVELDDQKVNVPKEGTSAYHVVMQGDRQATLGPARFPFTIFAGRFYTLVVEGAPAAPRLSVLADPNPDNPAKAILVLYNFTDREALRLATADGRTTVIPAVTRGMNASQDVNPLTVGLGVGEPGGGVLATLAPIALERGEVYGLIARGTGKTLQLHLVRGQTARPARP